MNIILAGILYMLYGLLIFLAAPILFCWVMFAIGWIKGYNLHGMSAMDVLDKLREKE